MGFLVLAGQAFGWGPDGHHTVGAIADRLLHKNAAGHVNLILGNIRLREASVWADCAKGVDTYNGYAYKPDPDRYPECTIFESLPNGITEMKDFVRANDGNCSHWSAGNPCHTLYHYTDIAVQRKHYKPGLTGARNDDIVNALTAAIYVLKGYEAPAPFNFQDRREALLLLAHYVGDIHQPLHVGAVYLDPDGNRLDPDRGIHNEQMDTQGGNLIYIDGDASKKLHALWDAIPDNLKDSEENIKAFSEKAVKIPPTGGPAFDWPRAWADETLSKAKEAFKDVTFGRKEGGLWSATLPAGYETAMDRIKEEQLVKAGARLAQLLNTIWP